MQYNSWPYFPHRKLRKTSKSNNSILICDRKFILFVKSLKGLILPKYANKTVKTELTPTAKRYQLIKVTQFCRNIGQKDSLFSEWLDYKLHIVYWDVNCIFKYIFSMKLSKY